MTLTVHCTKCGQGRIIASGYNAMAKTAVRRLEILRHMGWQPMPVLCRSCACPMDVAEMREAERIFSQKKPGGVSFALRLFKDKMKRAYKGREADVERWFASMPK